MGYEYQAHRCRPAKANMPSALKHPEEVDKYLEKEVRLGRVVGPLQRQDYPGVHVSRFGVIEKPRQPGKYRLILDLSHPEGHSVNDGIEPELCTLRYTSVDEAAARICARGAGTLLSKFDVESAYRIVPVHPDDRPLLGMEWRDHLYIDAALPFGLRSAPKIFNALADAVQWILEQEGLEVIHYLDDFLIIGSQDMAEGKQALRRALEKCRKLGIPIAALKTEGPSTVITFLGIELDTAAMTLRLPEEKLVRLQAEIARWKNRRACTKQELQSLTGQLQHACCVVRAGRTFLRRMFALLKGVKRSYHNVRLNTGFRSDLLWWATFLPSWNGVSMMARVSSPSHTLTSDASGNWGCGAYSSEGEWFQLKWPEAWSEVHITVKELLPIVIAVALCMGQSLGEQGGSMSLRQCSSCSSGELWHKQV